jgi:hypothetical protein
MTQPAQRSKTFRRGSRAFDEKAIGYTDDGTYGFTRPQQEIPTQVMITEQNFPPLRNAI